MKTVKYRYLVLAFHSATVPFFVPGDFALGVGLYLALNREGLADMTFKTNLVADQAVAAITFIDIAVQFASAGFGIVPFIVAIVVDPLASLSRRTASASKGPIASLENSAK